MSKAVMKQALDAFEAIMFEKNAESCQLIAKNARYSLREALAQPEHPLDKKADNARELGLDYDPIVNEKDGSPCPEFWDWLPKAYIFEGNRKFSKYNMEVAFLAGKNTALAQPEQEPIAWITRRTGDGGVVISGYETCEPTDYDAIPIYTAPPKRDVSTKQQNVNTSEERVQISDKNVHEPVAWMCENAVGYKYFRWKKPPNHFKSTPLYTTSPRKPWVGLTEDEVFEFLSCEIYGREDINNIEEVLRRKNGG